MGVALLDLGGVELAPALRRDWSTAAIRAETEVVGAPTGGMDQTVAMLGEAGAALLIDFDVRRSSVPVPLDLAGHTLLVTDTRVSHALTDGGYGSAARRLRGGGGRPGRRPRCGTPTSTRSSRSPTSGSAAVPATSSPRSSGSPTPSRPSATGDWDAVGRIFDASHALDA